jgi:hypothetical protein
VDAVDVSPIARCYGELKTAGLRNLDYEEFLGFFGTQDWRSFGKTPLNFETYRKLRDCISNTARSLFDRLITPGERHHMLEPGGIIIMNTSKMYKIKRQNPYLTGPYRFREAKARLKPVLFHPQDMIQFLAEHSAEYDVVHLSNIQDYGVDTESLVMTASQALEKGGQIVIIHFTKAVSVDFNDCREHAGFYRDFGLRARFKVTQDPVSEASICARIYLIPPGQIPPGQTERSKPDKYGSGDNPLSRTVEK